MATKTNSTELQVQKPKFSLMIKTDKWQNLINDTIKDPKKAAKFITAITSAVSVNKDLQECDAGSILSGALLGESLNLVPSPQLGQYYLVPFKDKKLGKRAAFILGYKGMIQLAIRSGQYKRINVVEIKEGELNHYDILTEEISCIMVEDEEEREKAETIGYYAMFELTNGFKKALYWNKAKIMKHADKYSPAFNMNKYDDFINHKVPEKDLWQYSSFWYKDFDSMAKKTMLRQLISKWGVMSTEFIDAMEYDDKVVEAHEEGIFTSTSIEEPIEDLPFEVDEATGEVDINAI